VDVSGLFFPGMESGNAPAKNFNWIVNIEPILEFGLHSGRAAALLQVKHVEGLQLRGPLIIMNGEMQNFPFSRD
jgi:hypothetical protein